MRVPMVQWRLACWRPDPGFGWFLLSGAAWQGMIAGHGGDWGRGRAGAD